MRFFKVSLIVCLTLLAYAGFGQMVQDNSKWSFEAKKISGKEYNILFHLKLPKDWHIYSMNPGGDGSLYPPSFTFDKNSKVKLIGKVKESGKLLSEVLIPGDPKINMYKNAVEYVQHVEILANTVVKGAYSYQICDDNKCINPTTKKFSITVTDAGEGENGGGAGAAGIDTNKTAAQEPAVAPATDSAPSPAVVPAATVKTDSAVANATTTQKEEEKKSLLWLFLAAFIGGLAAVITPCVYSMIPITVSFFTKRSKSRKEGIRNALYYAASIIMIFTILGVLVSLIFGAGALNSLSTNWIANMFFFVVFVVFGISFLGAFEITLPSSWTNATDSKAGVGSFSGIFFMALTLVIVSFSCTGPIVGPLLVAAGKGGIAGPAVGMFGFSVGLALPFALFAIFPGMLNKIASSGGWLNQVKVVLGFIELMLALKFFSNADLSQGWRLLDREVFVALWIVLAVLIGFYLLGKIKMSHDDKPVENVYGQEYVSIPKLFMAIGAFAFAVYLFPGMWGAPLNGVSAFVPPMGTFDAFGGSAAAPAASHEDNGVRPVKYVSDMKRFEPQVVTTLGLETYFDYDEALAASKKLKKPIMLDFTGINCVNCRKMESQVWSKPEVAKRLKEDFIVVSLYCDFNKLQLPKDQQYFSKEQNMQIETVGQKNTDLQVVKFGANSQPFYFYVDENGNKLIDGGYAYNPDVDKFVKHLDQVKKNYKKTHP